MGWGEGHQYTREDRLSIAMEGPAQNTKFLTNVQLEVERQVQQHGSMRPARGWGEPGGADSNSHQLLEMNGEILGVHWCTDGKLAKT